VIPSFEQGREYETIGNPILILALNSKHAIFVKIRKKRIIEYKEN